jgi:hypothetical protein
VLWGRIDPTLRNQVGLDRGASYRHALYAHSAEQLAQATASVEARQRALAPATVWQQGRSAAFLCHSLLPGPPLGRSASCPGYSTHSGGAPPPFRAYSGSSWCGRQRLPKVSPISPPLSL